MKHDFMGLVAKIVTLEVFTPNANTLRVLQK